MAMTTTTQASAAAGQTRPSRRLRRGWATPYLFILPFGVLFIIFFIVPILYAIDQSFYKTQRSGLGLGAATTAFNGLANYHDVFTDGAFYASVGRVLLYGIVQVPVMLGLALGLALLMDSAAIRFRNFFRLAFFVPYAVPGIIAALLWGFLYDPQLSPIVKGIRTIGFSNFDLLGGGTILWSIANIATWGWTGYNMLIIYAALQAISPEIYEAARMDGCTGFGVARYIKIPLVAPALVLTSVFSIIGTLQLFNEPSVLRAISNSISSSYTPNLYAYNVGFGDNNYYYAAAIAVVLALVTFVFSFGFLRITQRQAGV
jgi:multiple sugar transport system permease protein